MSDRTLSATELTPAPLSTRTGGLRLKAVQPIKAKSTDLLDNISGMLETRVLTTRYIEPNAIDPARTRRLAVEVRTSLNQLKHFMQEIEKARPAAPPAEPGENPNP